MRFTNVKPKPHPRFLVVKPGLNTFLKFLRGMQTKWKEYSIEIANSINIGYVNNTNEDNEKVGNFMPVLEYIGINRNVVDRYDIPYDDSSEIAAKKITVPKNHTDKQVMMWKVQNIRKTIENYNKIQEEAVQVLLNDYKISIRQSECIFPIFCIFLDNISNVLKIRFKELEGTDTSEIRINVLNLFEAFYSYDADEDQEVIEYAPTVAMKLALKNDEVAAE